MEFTVSFPSPHPTIQPVFEEVEPVVFVFGWEGAGDEDLTRYSRMYESWGCITVRYTSPARCVYLDQGGQGAEGDRIARRLASLLSELCVLDNPVMVHCLTVNGANMYVGASKFR